MNEHTKRKIESEFTILQTLSESIYSNQTYHVYLASPLTDTPQFFALKEIDSKRAKIYQKLCGKTHPNLASIYEVRLLSEEESPEYLAVMEFVHGTTLFDYVNDHGPLEPEEALDYATQIAQGLSFLHGLDLLHRDIKPENIIIATDEKNGKKSARIIDLGIAEVYDSQKQYATEFGGTRGYRAPEANDYTASPRSDIYSLGCVLNFMLCGYSPSAKRYSGIYEIEHIIDRSIDLDAGGRYPTTGQLIKVLEHARKTQLIDKVPVLRTLPGYRSHTGWHMTLATLYYCGLLGLVGFCAAKNAYGPTLGLLGCGILLPWLLCFDGAELYRLLPRKLRTNRHALRPFQAAILVLCMAFTIKSCAEIPGAKLLLGKIGITRTSANSISDATDTATSVELPESAQSEKTNESKETFFASEETYLEAIEDFKKGDYKDVIPKLESCVAAGWDGYAVYQYLGDSYYAAGDVDQAVTLLSHYLETVYRTVNVQVCNVLYQRLITWMPEASATVQEEYAEFMADADRYSTLYEELREISKNSWSYGNARRLLELKNEGACTSLFWYLYADYMTFNGKSKTAWEEVSPEMYKTDTYHTRQLTFTERVLILYQIYHGIDADTKTGRKITKEVEAYAKSSSDYEGCGIGLTDVDPQTGRDINGKLKDVDTETASVKKLLQSYEFIRSNPYLNWPGTIDWFWGNEIYCIDDYDEDISNFHHKYRLYYATTDHLILERFDPDSSEEPELMIQINADSCKDPEKLTGTWTKSDGNKDCVIKLRGVAQTEEEKASGAFHGEVKILDKATGTYTIPWTEVRFENNQAMIEQNYWKLQLILGIKTWQIDPTTSDRIPEAEDIDTIVLNNIDTINEFQEAAEGAYEQ